MEAVSDVSRSDLVGRVQIPVEELMAKPNQMIRREDGLMGFEDSNDMPGEFPPNDSMTLSRQR